MNRRDFLATASAGSATLALRPPLAAGTSDVMPTMADFLRYAWANRPTYNRLATDLLGVTGAVTCDGRCWASIGGFYAIATPWSFVHGLGHVPLSVGRDGETPGARRADRVILSTRMTAEPLPDHLATMADVVCWVHMGHPEHMCVTSEAFRLTGDLVYEGFRWINHGRFCWVGIRARVYGSEDWTDEAFAAKLGRGLAAKTPIPPRDSLRRHVVEIPADLLDAARVSAPIVDIPDVFEIYEE